MHFIGFSSGFHGIFLLACKTFSESYRGSEATFGNPLGIFWSQLCREFIQTFTPVFCLTIVFRNVFKLDIKQCSFVQYFLISNPVPHFLAGVLLWDSVLGLLIKLRVNFCAWGTDSEQFVLICLFDLRFRLAYGSLLYLPFKDN